MLFLHGQGRHLVQSPTWTHRHDEGGAVAKILREVSGPRRGFLCVHDPKVSNCHFKMRLMIIDQKLNDLRIKSKNLNN